MADDARGGTGYLTLTSAWQRVAADRLRYGIYVAVCSYEGYVGLLWSDQDAIDSLARNADVLVVGMGGNEGATGQPALFSYSATNMLAQGDTAACDRPKHKRRQKKKIAILGENRITARQQQVADQERQPDPEYQP